MFHRAPRTPHGGTEIVNEHYHSATRYSIEATAWELVNQGKFRYHVMCLPTANSEEAIHNIHCRAASLDLPSIVSCELRLSFLDNREGVSDKDLTADVRSVKANVCNDPPD